MGSCPLHGAACSKLLSPAGRDGGVWVQKHTACRLGMPWRLCHTSIIACQPWQKGKGRCSSWSCGAEKSVCVLTDASSFTAAATLIRTPPALICDIPSQACSTFIINLPLRHLVIVLFIVIISF